MLNWKEAIEADAKRLKALSIVNNQEEEGEGFPRSDSAFDPSIRFNEP